MFMGLAILIVAAALHLAWIGRLARDRGRSVVPWILVGLTAGGIGLRIGLAIASRAVDTEGTFVGLLGTMTPLPLTLGSMLVVALVLYWLPTYVPVRREWKVSSPKTGEGMLVIEPGAIQIRWDGHTDTIERPQLRSAVADGECMRLSWTGGELLLMPMMSPQTRQGRIRQSELLAKLLAPSTEDQNAISPQ
jgi:hypothetical protein